MARTTGRSGFKMRSGNKPGFKNMGSKVAQMMKDKTSDTMQDIDMIKTITNPDLQPETRKIAQRIYKDAMYKNKKDSPADLKSFGFAKGTSPLNYEIKSGDTLSEIAKANNTTVEELMKANPNIKDASKIQAGQTLNLSSNKEENKNQESGNNKNTGSEVDDSAGAEKGTGQPKMSKGAAIGSILASSLTSGLDAVYGTGKVMPPGSKVVFTKDKDKKQKTTDDVEAEIDKRTKIQ